MVRGPRRCLCQCYTGRDKCQTPTSYGEDYERLQQTPVTQYSARCVGASHHPRSQMLNRSHALMDLSTFDIIQR